MKAAFWGSAVLLLPAVSWAGGVVTVPTAAPAMDEPGLLMLALGLVGTGLALMRRRNK